MEARPEHPSRALLYRLVYWTLPVVLLVWVFSRVDLQALTDTIAQADLRWVFGGVLATTAMLLGGGLRWWVLLRSQVDAGIPVAYALRKYWIGFAFGRFVPGSVGWDIYRIAAVGRRYERLPLKTAVTIATEKVVGLLTAALMVMLLYPMAVRNLTAGATLPPALWTSAFALLLSALLLGGILFSSLGAGIRNRLKTAVHRWANAASSHLTGTNESAADTEAVQAAWRSGGVGWRTFTLVFATSVIVPVLAATGNHLFFLALGLEVPFLVNLFLVPLFSFIGVVPISFGGLGLREGMYLVLYGMFGVAAEAALLVSLLNLTALLLNVAAGGFLHYAGLRSPSPVTGAPPDRNDRGVD